MKAVAILLVCIGATTAQLPTKNAGTPGYCGTVQENTRKIYDNIGTGVEVSGMDECGQLCDSTDNCVGATFTPEFMECWMHTDISGAISQEGHHLYTKAECSSEPGCIHVDHRIIGYNIPFNNWGQAGSVGDCRAECDSRAECIGASMQPPDNRCYLHNGVDDSKIFQDNGWKLYYKSCPSGLGGTVHQCIREDYRVIGFNIPFDNWGKAGSVEDCLAECDSRSECTNASLQPPDNRCYLHNGIDAASTHDDAGWKLYYKNCQAS